MPPIEKKIAKNGEIIRLYEEVSNLKQKITDTNTQIKEERQINARLLSESEAREQQSAKIEVLITKEEEKHRWNKQMIQDNMSTLESQTRERFV